MKLNLFILFLIPLSLFSQSNTQNEKRNGDIVQKHITPFNTRNIEAFAKAFDMDVLVSLFPDDTMYLGREKLKENYLRFFNKNKKTNVKVLNRIVLNDRVIDEELSTVNFTTNRHITIYKVANNSIKSMTFIKNSKTTSNPEIVVNKQLEAYNKRDIDAFVETYTDDVKLYRFPNNLISEGHEAIKKQYASLFKRASDLNAQIVNRMVLGNKIIDKERVTANGKIFYAIAIYEIQNEKISKVTFIK